MITSMLHYYLPRYVYLHRQADGKDELSVSNVRRLELDRHGLTGYGKFGWRW